MIDYNTVQTALEDVIKLVYSDPDFDVCGDDVCLYWLNSADEGEWLNWPSISMTLRSETAFGIDEVRDALEDDGSPLAIPSKLQSPGPGPVPDLRTADRMVQVQGQRSMVWVVRIETECQTPLGESARAQLSRLRTELRSAPVQAILRAAGIALSIMDPVVNFDFQSENDRWISASSMDVTLLTTAHGRPYGVQEVAKVEITNTIPDPDTTIEVQKP